VVRAAVLNRRYYRFSRPKLLHFHPRSFLFVLTRLMHYYSENPVIEHGTSEIVARNTDHSITDAVCFNIMLFKIFSSN
jgi:hypothetical protein